jgi:hypothetical protein
VSAVTDCATGRAARRRAIVGGASGSPMFLGPRSDSNRARVSAVPAARDIEASKGVDGDVLLEVFTRSSTATACAVVSPRSIFASNPA